MINYVCKTHQDYFCRSVMVLIACWIWFIQFWCLRYFLFLKCPLVCNSLSFAWCSTSKLSSSPRLVDMYFGTSKGLIWSWIKYRATWWMKIKFQRKKEIDIYFLVRETTYIRYTNWVQPPNWVLHISSAFIIFKFILFFLILWASQFWAHRLFELLKCGQNHYQHTAWENQYCLLKNLINKKQDNARKYGTKNSS